MRGEGDVKVRPTEPTSSDAAADIERGEQVALEPSFRAHRAGKVAGRHDSNA